MKIIFQQVTLTNFKGIRSLNVTLRPDEATISGANRTGKTTLADAMTWCLFGKDSKARSQFGIKTRDAEGNEIPNLTHSVTLTFSADGIEHIITRSLIEKWTRVRGSKEPTLQGHVTECYVDGEKTTIRDYQNFISSIIPEEQFRILTTPTYFTSMNWEEQRRILTQMCEPATIQEIAQEAIRKGNREEDVEYVCKMLQTKTLPDAAKHLAYISKDIQRKLEDFPVKIEEDNALIPEKTPEWDSADQQLAEVREQIHNIRKNGAASAATEAIDNKIAFASKRLTNIQISAETKAAELRAAHDREVTQCQYDIEACRQKIKAIKAAEANEDATSKRVEAQMQLYEKNAESIRMRWKENGERKLLITEDDTVCPSCGQPLPEEKLAEHIEEMRKKLADDKAETYKKLTEEANEIKACMVEAKKLMATAKADAQKAREQLSEVVAHEKELSATLDEITAQQTPTAREILQSDENYTTITSQLQQLKKEREDIHAKPQDEQQILSLQEQERNLLRILQQRELHGQITARIEDMRKQQQQLAEQLAEVERRYFTATDMQQAADDLLEMQANKMFNFVQFRLFRTQVNGTRVPYCEAHVGGVPFSDLNTADRINAGIDIISTLSRHYGISAPIIIDNAEAVNRLLDTPNQKIQLYVTTEKTLQVR